MHGNVTYLCYIKFFRVYMLCPKNITCEYYTDGKVYFSVNAQITCIKILMTRIY